jgi:hypothetical protein
VGQDGQQCWGMAELNVCAMQRYFGRNENLVFYLLAKR